VWVVLLIGIIAAACAAIFIRYAQGEGVPSLLVAAGRLTLATLVLAPINLLRYRADIASLTRREWLLIAASGFFLAIHFATWIASLEYTAVLISVVMVSTGPIWVALLEVFFLRARLGLAVIIGIGIAVVGGVIIGFPTGGGGVTFDQRTLIGAGLALIGAITVSVYVVIGRQLRARIALMPYIFLVYGVAALLLLLTVGLTRTPITGYSTAGYGWIILLALVPQLLGHSSFNYALGYLPATLLSVMTQIEPVFGAVAAFFLFNEVPTGLQIAGSVVLLIGVIVAIVGQGREGK
jgi:drug/metabolite transporter (DMT)-like permease